MTERMDLYAALKQCWDKEKRDWKPGWMVALPGPTTWSPGEVDSIWLFDGSQWSVVRPKVTLREAMKALLRGEAREAKRHPGGRGYAIIKGVLCFDEDPNIDAALRVLAGIDPDTDAEWELVR
jgi:hypothetical protein